MIEPIRVDIVSDVVCPWCIVGFLQLQSACRIAGIGCQVFWHPFELNPQMPPEGQDLGEHLRQKYGTTPDQSRQTRETLAALGHELGFTFTFSDTLRMHNTFPAHQLIRAANCEGLAHEVKMALFKAHFTDNLAIGQIDVLADIAAAVGLDAERARTDLETGIHAAAVRAEEEYWMEQGISGVPAMVFERKYLLTGAQGTETYAQILREVAAHRAA